MKWIIGTITLIVCALGILAFNFFTSMFLNRPIGTNSPMSVAYPSVSPSSILSYASSPVSIDTVFNKDHAWTATLSAERVTTLIATGDIIPARSVNYKTMAYGDFTWPYRYIAPLLQNADITFINLESPLLENCPVTNEGMIFCGDAKHMNGLTYTGVDVTNIANNHIANYGVDGVEETVRHLTNTGIAVSGKKEPAIIEKNGVRFAFLGYNDIGLQEGVSHVIDETFEQDITRAKDQADVVIVSFHWGTEYVPQPSDHEITIAHRAVDAGADLVIGNHPHWIQPIEIYKNGFITYAHGNTVFDQMWSKETREGVIGAYTFYDKKLIDVQFTPLIIEDYGQPRIAEGEEKTKVLEKMEKQSVLLYTSIQDKLKQ